MWSLQTFLVSLLCVVSTQRRVTTLAVDQVCLGDITLLLILCWLYRGLPCVHLEGPALKRHFKTSNTNNSKSPPTIASIQYPSGQPIPAVGDPSLKGESLHYARTARYF